MRLSTKIHDRDVAGLRYVYPVVSRRARGVSLGINLNPNKACNFRCIYCQVAGLEYGSGPPIEIDRLRRELRSMLAALLKGDYMQRHVPEDSRELRDVAISGDGEPTSSPQFAEAIECVAELLGEFELAGTIKLVLITNGSLAHKPEVQTALRRMARLNGEVWFKLDSATEAGLARINNYRGGLARLVQNLRSTAKLCPTLIQTCLFAQHGSPPDEAELDAYLDLLRDLAADTPQLAGVLLYGLARVSHQPEGKDLTALSPEWMRELAQRVEALGLSTQVDP